MSVVPATRSTCIILYFFLLFFLFDSFLFGTGEIEHPLLQNSGVAIGWEGVLARIVLVNHTLDPHIHGGTLHAAIGKQGHAVGHLDAHAVLLHQSFQQPGIGQGFQRGKVQRSRCNRLGVDASTT